MKKNNYINIAFFIVILTIVSLSIGYSALYKNLGVQSIETTFLYKDIRITNVSVYSSSNNGISSYEEYDNSNMDIRLSLPNSTSSVTYKVEVTNFGNAEMGIYNITGLPENLDYSITDYNLKEKICDDTRCNLGVIKEFFITISYKDTSSINNITDHNVVLNFIFEDFHQVQYNNINTSNGTFPTSIMHGDTLVVNFGIYAPYSVSIYSNNVLITDFTYQNKVLTIPNISSDIIIQGTGESSYDVPVTENNTEFIIVDGSSGTTVNVADLFDLSFDAVNGTSKIINAVELNVIYTSTTGSNQQIISILTHNNIEHKVTLAFQGKKTNQLLTIRFDNLSIGMYDTFTLSNTNSKLTNGSIQIISEELKIFFSE